ncbi:phytanoyl-CoA dioxygenase family protein [Noviherbaspirillum galbum]|uniref:Phytanoyl-CoA dioxygenase family protein n=1 Tax=Noviherbaspirillum galbum TaxID=2709383 RepID=A0A6B3SXG5_9BURK|nr:phytanoyl-CoA dioxygenase family protein [Noviherbaspirillum galbum]NEX63192.1 phytanoyl-CoA dioxygenase family protein [Noviherbaspirillum galbum]
MTLSDIELEQFQRDGFLVFRKMATPVACDLMRAVTREQLKAGKEPLEYEAVLGYPGAPASLDAPGGRTIRRLKDAYHRHPCYRAWAEDERIAGRVRQIVGETPRLVLAHHNCVMTKHPGYGTATGWHRDIRYWSFARNALVTVWLALGDETAANGALHVIPGSHRIEIARHRLDELDFLRPEVPENQELIAQETVVELEKGDVLFFHSGLFHAAGRNEGNTVKMSVAFAYRGESNLPGAGSRSAAAGDVALPAART